MSTRYKVLSTLAIAAVTLIGGTLCAGAVVSVDFQNDPGQSSAVTYSGQAAIAAPGNTWNSIDPGVAPQTPEWGEIWYGSGVSRSSLLDSEGNTTGVSVALSDLAGIYTWNGWDPSNNSVECTSHLDLMEDFALKTGTATATIGGLTPGSYYDLAIYGHSHEAAGVTSFTVGSVTKSTVNATVQHSLSAWIDYVNFNGAVADGAGQIQVSISNGGNEARINGLQIKESQPMATPLVTDTNLLSEMNTFASSEHSSFPATSAVNGQAADANDFVFNPDGGGDGQQRLVISGFTGPVELIRIWSNGDLKPGQVCIKSSTSLIEPTAGDFANGQTVGESFETLVRAMAGMTTWVTADAVGTDTTLQYIDFVIDSPIAGTKSLYFDFGAGNGGMYPDWGACRIAEIQAFPIPEPGTLALLAAGLVGLLAYAWRKRR